MGRCCHGQQLSLSSSICRLDGLLVLCYVVVGYWVGWRWPIVARLQAGDDHMVGSGWIYCFFAPFHQLGCFNFGCLLGSVRLAIRLGGDERWWLDKTQTTTLWSAVVEGSFFAPLH